MPVYRLLAFLLPAVLCAGCTGAPPRVVAEAPASNSGAQAIKAFDANLNGSLDEKELEKLPGLKSGLKKADENLDGELSAKEIDARIDAWARSKVGRMTVACIIKHQGAPLANAEVKFIPESFLGSSLQTATGTTGANGMVMPSAPESDEKPPGVAPGFYRIEVTAPAGGPPLPAPYNTESLGMEVAPDVEALATGPIQIDLK